MFQLAETNIAAENIDSSKFEDHTFFVMSSSYIC